MSDALFLGLMNVVVYLLAGLFCGRVYWNINATHKAYLIAEDALIPIFLFFFWPVWVVWLIGRLCIGLFFNLADMVSSGFVDMNRGKGKTR